MYAYVKIGYVTPQHPLTKCQNLHVSYFVVDSGNSSVYPTGCVFVCLRLYVTLEYILAEHLNGQSNVDFVG